MSEIAQLSAIAPPATAPGPRHEADVARNWEYWREKAAEVKDEALAAFMQRVTEDETLSALTSAVFAYSPYLSRLLVANPAVLREYHENGPESAFQEILTLMQEHQSALSELNDTKLMRELRINKNRAALVAALADVSGKWSLEEVTSALSDYAQAALTLSVDYLLHQAYQRQEVAAPEGEWASPSHGTGLVILAMGKLGARELNYSSDIDIIIFYEAGRLEYKGRYNEQRFYTRIAHDLVNLMQERTPDGYVFRTDLRLRPDPASTPPAVSTLAALSYYESVGQNWERAAMIKARPIAGDLDAANEFLRQITPFVWRKSLDFASVRDIQSIKRQMDTRVGSEIELAGHNVKLGLGGIREIEFFTQIHQLIWGGRMPSLRSRATCETLAQLATSDLIEMEVASDLTRAYVYLRCLEHRLQMIEDQQTHSLPEDGTALDHVAGFMGYESVGQFGNDLLSVLHRVHAIFAGAFPDMEPLAHQGNLVFTGTNSDPGTLQTLANMGFKDTEHISETVMSWHHGARRATRTKRARELLTELMPTLLKRLSETANPDDAFFKFDEFLTRIPAGVQLFSLFTANPHLLGLIADIMGSAPVLAETLSRHPNLLESVLYGNFYEELSLREELEDEITEALAHSETFEDRMEELRRFCNEKHFQAGIQIIEHIINAEQTGRFLSRMADVVIARTLRYVTEEFEQSYGTIPGGRFCVLGLGKLGSKELTFGSDIDIIFVYDTPDEEAVSSGKKGFTPSVYYNRLAQRLLNALIAMGKEGRLYEADTRLRPFGNEGLTAISLPAFDNYYRENAWTFEFMAMTRARPVAGETALMQEVQDTCHSYLTRPRPADKLLEDVRDMRRRIEEEFSPKDMWDLKHAHGGLMELDFICQYLYLLHASNHPAPNARSSQALLEHLLQEKLLEQPIAEELMQANRFLLELLNIMRLCFIGKVDESEAMPGLKKLLAEAVDLPDFAAVKTRLAEVETAVHQHYMDIIGQ